MRSTTTFSITFFTRKLKSSTTEGGLYCRITYNSRPIEISLKRRILIDLWDSNKNKLKGNSVPARVINQFIQETRTEIYSIYEEIRKSKKHVDVKAIKARYLNEEPKEMTLVKAFEYHNSKMVADFAPGTCQTWSPQRSPFRLTQSFPRT